ncbi:sensor histidine kinase [Paraclostridium bifermentans]|uniref:sensor histidine kinase n=1 Tax=Paraclostridium bifermentans TaxID=1490 RepID=UPI00359C360A
MIIKKGIKIYILIFILSTIIQNFTYNAHAYNINQKGFNVLVLNSYHQEHYWESSILSGLKDYIDENEKGINLKFEFLDFRNNYEEEYIKSLKKMLRDKYPKGSIDVIYTVNDEAYEVLGNEVLNKESNFYKIPLVFSGVDNKISSEKSEKKYSAGIYHGDDSLTLMTLIRDLTPNVKNMNLIIENSGYGDSVQFEIDRIIDEYLNGDIKLNYIRTNYSQDVFNELEKKKEQDNTINIIAGEFQDKVSKKYEDPKNLINEIKKYTSAPIYSNDPTYMNAKILGGYMDDGKKQGETIGNMIIKIKKGTRVYDIKNVFEPRAEAYVDYDSIYEYNIDPLSVDKNINIINKKPHEIVAPRWVKSIIVITMFLIMMLVLFIIQTATSHKKINKKRLEEEEKAKEREQLKSDFIVNLSHELRTPINIILGTSKVIENRTFKGDISEEYILEKLENINTNSYRLLKISNNIIDITKAESGMFKLNLENCNIVNIVEPIFEESIDFGIRKNIGMIFDTKEEEIRTAIDVYQIQRVISNLLSNSIKFTNFGGIINLEVYKNVSDVVIEVRDSGVGIPEDKLNYIFHKFYQVDNLYTRKNEGSGIGLCVVKEIIDMHNGKIEIESTVNKGTKFKIYIPIVIDDTLCEYDNKDSLDINKIVELEMSDI